MTPHPSPLPRGERVGVRGNVQFVRYQNRAKIPKIPLAIPMIMKIPMKEPVIRRRVPSNFPFLRKKLTMLPERMPKPRMGRAESRISPTFPRAITFFRMGLSSKWPKK